MFDKITSNLALEDGIESIFNSSRQKNATQVDFGQI
jgi:hypothetical protein